MGASSLKESVSNLGKGVKDFFDLNKVAERHRALIQNPEFEAYNAFMADENNKRWLNANPEELGRFSGIPEAKRRERDSLLSEAEKAYKSRTEKEAQTKQITDSMDTMVKKINEPKPTKQYPGDEESELERTKRLEALRAGIMSTRKFKGSGSSGLLSPAQSIYGSGLKTKLGQ